jgi:hypothetical protein
MMDTSSWFMISFILGTIGIAYIVYGRKQLNLVAIIAGIGLCVFPYFVSNVWVTIALAIGLVILPFVIPD